MTRVLVTSLGAPSRGYSLSTYRLHNSDTAPWQGKFAGLAVRDLLGPFDNLIVLVTERSEKHLAEFKKAAGVRQARRVPVPEPLTEGDQYSAIDKIVGAVEEIATSDLPDIRITLDITFGFRSQPLLYFAALAFLKELQGAEVEHVVYAHRKDPARDEYEIVELTPAYEMIDWAYAVRTFVDSGDTGYLARILDRRVQMLRARGEPFKTVDDIRKCLSGFSNLVGAALPIELGNAAKSLLDKLDRRREELREAKIFWRLIDSLTEVGEQLSCSLLARNKATIPLTREVIEHQIRVTEWALSHNQIANVVAILREAAINLILLRRSSERWLDRSEREEAAYLLSSMERMMKRGDLRDRLTDFQQEFLAAFVRIRDHRNRMAHCGFTENRVSLTGLDDDIRNFVEVLRRGLDELQLPQQGTAHILVSPLGLSIGSLYTALLATQPDHLIALVTKKSRGSLKSVLEAASFPESETTVLDVKDPHAGFEEIPSLVSRAEDTIISARVVIGNITGGTTMMSEAVRAILEMARSYAVQTKTYAMVDRRPLEEQKRNPFVKGEAFQINGCVNDD